MAGWTAMKFGLQINQFTWPGGGAAIGPTLARVARTADDASVARQRRAIAVA